MLAEPSQEGTGYLKREEVSSMGKKKKLGLVPKLIIGIILGILIGSFCPEIVCRIVVTASGLFSTFLKFVIPMMILAYVTMGIADLSQGAGKLLAITRGCPTAPP